MPETRVTIAGRVHRLDIEYREKAYLLVEVECTAEGTHSTKGGDVPTRKIMVSDALRLSGDLPVEMLDELRRIRREAEGDDTGIDVIPGLEGFLDAGGVVVTEADGVAAPPKPIDGDSLADDEAGAIVRWRELGQRVHFLVTQIEGEKPGDAAAEQAELDRLWAELNRLLPGDVVQEGVIIDEEGNERAPIELPDIEYFDLTSKPEASEPWDGYDDLKVDEIIDHIDEYLDADQALGGPSPQSRAYVAAAHEHEAAHKNRKSVVSVLDARLAAVDDYLKLNVEVDEIEPDGPPWETYDGTSADGIIQHLKDVAENEGPDAARPLIAAVDAYESAGKARKGVLGRLPSIVPPPIPDGPDLELELDEDDEFEPDEDESIEDTRDIAALDGED